MLVGDQPLTEEDRALIKALLEKDKEKEKVEAIGDDYNIFEQGNNLSMTSGHYMMNDNNLINTAHDTGPTSHYIDLMTTDSGRMQSMEKRPSLRKRRIDKMVAPPEAPKACCKCTIF